MFAAGSFLKGILLETVEKGPKSLFFTSYSLCLFQS